MDYVWQTTEVITDHSNLGIDDPKHLFVRLFLRNQKYWQRQSKLDGRYREIKDLESAIRQLSTTGLLMDQDAMHDPGEAIALLTVDELKVLARSIGILEKMSGKQVCSFFRWSI